MTQTDQERQTSLVLVSVIFTSISAFAVLARSIVRFIVIRNPGMDDYTILGALLFAIGYLLEILIAKSHGVGFPAETLSINDMLVVIQITLAIEATYYLIVGFIKISIIYLYLRFAVSQTFRMLCYSTIAFEVVFTAICLCVTFSQCAPLEKMWDLTGTQVGVCINTTAFFYSTSGINIITDIWILTLPIKTLGLINRPAREKVALGFIFGAGTFATIMSVVRLQSIYTYTLSKDPFKDAIAVNLWSMLEVNVAILCASVPALKPIFTPERIREFRRQQKNAGSKLYYKGNSKNKNKNISSHPHYPKDDDPFGVYSSGGPIGSRKPSNASLYPDLEDGLDLDKVSPPTRRSGGTGEDENGQQELESYFQVPVQRAYQAI